MDTEKAAPQEPVSETVGMTLSEARRIIADPSQSLPAQIIASCAICELPSATLRDLVDCLSIPERSATWRPATLLHERTSIPKRVDEHGWIVIDVDFWHDYISHSPAEDSNANTRDAEHNTRADL